VADEDVVELTFDQALVVRVDVTTRELRFQLGEVADPSAPHVVHLPAEGRTAIPEGLLDEEDKLVLRDPRVVRAYELLASGSDRDGEGAWTWSEGVADAANECLARLVKRAPSPPA
jgi:hypothetical protein